MFFYTMLNNTLTIRPDAGNAPLDPAVEFRQQAQPD